jgi:hypothetical protein
MADHPVRPGYDSIVRLVVEGVTIAEEPVAATNRTGKK